MEVTEVRISLREAGNRKLKAFATITFDDEFVVRDIKIIEGRRGLFVAMPSTKIMESCSACGKKNPIRNTYCSECGAKQSLRDQAADPTERREEHRDICHPIRPEFRHYVQSKIVNAYLEKVGAPVHQSGQDAT